MSIEEIREARKEAQRQIQDVLSSFHAATGLRIHEIDVCSVGVPLVGQEHPKVVSQFVLVTLESI